MIESRSSDVALEHVTVQASAAGGLYARDASPSIRASRFADNAGYAVELDGLAAGADTRLTDTEFATAAAGQRAGRLRFGDHPGQIDLRGTRAGGSGWNGLVLEGEVVRDLDLDTTGGMPLIVTGRVTVASGATLTLHPGTVVKAWDWDWKVLVNGALMAEGTAAAPIVFTSLRDDVSGGDTNGDGDASAPAARDWGLVGFAAGSRGRLTHAAVRYGGYFSGFGLRGMVEARGTDDVQLESVALTDSGADALYVDGASVRLRGSVAGNAYGVRNGTPAQGVVDARHVWWGDASGPLHRLTNPSGTANEVSDGVRFFPGRSTPTAAR